MTEEERGRGFEPESSSFARQGDYEGRPQAIERAIGETRNAIGEDLRELGERLSPEHLKEGAKAVAKEAVGAAVGHVKEVRDRAYQKVSERVGEVGEQARRAGSATANIVSKNALPLTLIGVGVSWMTLAARRSRQGSNGWYEEVGPYRGEYRGEPRSSILAGEEPSPTGGVAHHFYEGGERVEEMERGVTDKVRDARDKARDKATALQARARDLRSEARDRIHGASERTRELATENPLALTAAAVAAGIGIGLLLPLSRQESQLLSGTRDLVRGKTREALQEGREAARQIASTARETASVAKNVLHQPS